MPFHPNSIVPEAALARPMTECAQCGEQLFVPEWSEFVDEHCVRHRWQCEACGYAFETTISYREIAA
jgi:ribosomal protein S27AE